MKKLPYLFLQVGELLGVADGARTRDTQDHNLVLYQLNYSHHCCLKCSEINLSPLFQNYKNTSSWRVGGSGGGYWLLW